MRCGLPARLPDLLILGQENWDEVERRNQLLIRALAARNERARFLFVESAIRPRAAGTWRFRRPESVAQNVWTVRVLRPFPDSMSSALSDRAEAAQITHAIRQVGLDRPLLWTQAPHSADLLDHLDVTGIIYDLTDDWAAFEIDPIRRAEVQRRIERLTREANIVLACSRQLCASAERLGVTPVYVPNAIGPATTPSSVARSLEAFPRPRLGYVGTLHSSRLDVQLVAAAARLRPEWSFAFLGPDMLDVGARSLLFAPQNVHYLGVAKHRDVPSFLCGLDIGLMPNRDTEFTRSLDPLKAYEYLAAGLPVIGTPAGISPELAPWIETITTPDQLVARAELLIAENDLAAAESRRASVAHETWNARAKIVEQALGVGPSEPSREAVSVLIVSFNTRALLEQCLDAVTVSDGTSKQVIVVDNGSTDGSREMVATRFPTVELIELPGNVGFGAANNIGFEHCRGEFVLLLNSDAFVHDDTIIELLSVARRHPHAAAVGPRLVNPDGSLQRSAWPFPSPWRLLLEAAGLHRVLRQTLLYDDLGIWDHDTERAVDFLVGACLLVRRAALTEVRGFDEAFWLYAEEADLQRRLADRGWSAILAPHATVTHIGGASSTVATERLQLFYAGQMLFLRRHRGVLAVALARLALLVGSLVRGRWMTARLALRPRWDKAGQRAHSFGSVDVDGRLGSP
jgi:N-acetylglucosaminyl-diphospho-decaprenol L-rhamnosyltransferase